MENKRGLCDIFIIAQKGDFEKLSLKSFTEKSNSVCS